MTDRSPSRLARTLRRLAPRLALALLGAAVLPELLLRFLLFSDLVPAWLGGPLRREALYALPGSRESWALRARFEPLSPAQRTLLHPELGYLGQAIDPRTYRHADESGLRDRRPVLLYGDSYAQCVTRAQWCWQGLLEESELGERYALLNYGVGGYGLDQACLLLEHSVDLYAERDPIVVVCILVDDDLDRCFLPVRDCPKPRFELEDGALVAYPPPPTTPAGIVEAPIGIKSYAWNAIVCGTGLFSSAQRRRWLPGPDEGRIQALGERVVERLDAELAARGLTHFFLLFHGRGAVKTPGPYTWREASLYATFARLGSAFVSSKRWLWQDACETKLPLDGYYIGEGARRGKNHYTAAANRVVFAALRAGLEGRFEPYEYLAGATRPPAAPADPPPPREER